jgi:branched-subunit amino acid aminotransferase/4-amino-4-deoxychorismate lyase
MDNLNSAFLFGSSVFTTAKVENGFVVDWRLHLRRLLTGLQSYFFLESTENLAIRLSRIRPPKDFTGALRVTVFIKDSKSMDQPVDEDDLDFAINFRKLKTFKHEPIVLKLTKRVQSPDLDQIKIGSYGKEIFLRKKAKAQGADDILFYGEGLVFETTIANIFFRKGEQLYTPKNGIYKGLSRQKLIDDKGVIEKDIKLSDLQQYDEIFTASSLFDKIIVKDIIDDK